MTERRYTADTINDDELDALYRKLAVAELAATADRTFKWYADDAQRRLRIQRERAEQAEATIKRVRVLVAGRWGSVDPGRVRDALDEQPGPAATEATEATETEKTAQVFAALHRSAEQSVTRVIDLYERWLKAGPPPLGTSTSRWWDARLVELHNAIQSPTTQNQEQTCITESSPQTSPAPSPPADTPTP